KSAESQREDGHAETQLLLAGLAAERAEDVSLAITTYRDAGTRFPTSPGPPSLLMRVGYRTSNTELVREATRSLAAMEITNGAPGIHVLCDGELELFLGNPGAIS